MRHFDTTRAATSYQVGSPVPAMTRLDGDVLLFVLVALARQIPNRCEWLTGAPHERATSIVQFLSNAGLDELAELLLEAR